MKRENNSVKELLLKGSSRHMIIPGLAGLLDDSASEMIFPLLSACITVVFGAEPIARGVVEGLKDIRSFILEAI